MTITERFLLTDGALDEAGWEPIQDLCSNLMADIDCAGGKETWQPIAPPIRTKAPVPRHRFRRSPSIVDHQTASFSSVFRLACSPVTSPTSHQDSDPHSSSFRRSRCASLSINLSSHHGERSTQGQKGEEGESHAKTTNRKFPFRIAVDDKRVDACRLPAGQGIWSIPSSRPTHGNHRRHRGDIEGSESTTNTGKSQRQQQVPEGCYHALPLGVGQVDKEVLRRGSEVCPWRSPRVVQVHQVCTFHSLSDGRTRPDQNTLGTFI